MSSRPGVDWANDGHQVVVYDANLELRLSVEDSPNSAGVAIDLIRCARIARDRGLSGAITAPASYFCKHPPVQTTDDLAFEALEAFIRGD